MIPSLRSFCPLLALTFTGVAAAHGQFNPYGSSTIDKTHVTTAQTLSAGIGTITSTGAISLTSGTSVALTVSGTNTVLNNGGFITSGGANTGRALVADGSGLQITNGSASNTGALIQAVANDAVRSSSAGTSVALTNYGTISANPNSTTTNPQQAIDWNSITTGANRVDNYGTIRANGNDAIRPGVNGVISNYAGATISSANLTGNTSSDGIDAQTNTGVQLFNSGLVEGGRHGITGGLTTGTGAYAISITNNTGAILRGNNGGGVNIDGINGNETATIVNHGTITGNGSALVGTNTSQDGDGVDVDGLVKLTNDGTIRSINAIGDTSEGVTVGGGTITNLAGGLIEGDVASGNTSGALGKGITVLGIDSVNPIAAMYGNTVITNSGTIRGQTTSAITVGVSNAGIASAASGFTTTITNNAGGLIEGGGTTAAVIQTGADNDTVNNAGQIVADGSNLAIDLGAGNNTLNITGGSASITGNVSGGKGGTNTLSITPGSGNRFTYTGSFSNFATVQIGVGRVTLSGASTYTGTTTVANGGVLVANTAVAAGSATGSGAVTIQSGGTLAGMGQVAGVVTLAAGAHLDPGDSGVGTLSLGADLNVVGGSTFDYDLGSSQNSDRLTLAGTLAFTGSGQLTFNLTDAGGLAPGRYDLIDLAGSTGLTTDNLSFGAVPAGFSATFFLNGTELGIDVSSVPEPSSWALLGFGLASLGWAGAVAARHSRKPASGE